MAEGGGSEEDYELETIPFGGETAIEPRINRDRVNRYREAAEEFGIDPGRIYHPAQYDDVSPSEAFPNADVVYVDRDEDAVEALQDGYDVREGDAEDYELEEEADLIILMSQMFDVVPALEKNLEEEGWVFANNYHGAASTLREMQGYDLRAAVPGTRANHPNTETEAPRVETEELDLHWERVTNEDDYKAWKPGRYEMARKKVDEEVGENIGLFEGLKEIKRDRIRDRINNLESLEGNQERIDALEEELDEPEILGPRKKGSTETLYVFQKA